MSVALAEPPKVEPTQVEPTRPMRRQVVEPAPASNGHAVGPTRHPKRFTVEEFDALDEAGVLPQRVELVDGEIVEMEPVKNPHSICRYQLNRILTPVCEPPRFLRSQDTHRFANGWCPQPDFALLDQFPQAGAVVDPPVRLVIEISDSTLEYDLHDKRLRYAQVGVPEYVVADLPHRKLHVFRQPDAQARQTDEAYKVVEVLGLEDVYSPNSLDLKIKVADVLPEVEPAEDAASGS